MMPLTVQNRYNVYLPMSILEFSTFYYDLKLFFLFVHKSTPIFKCFALNKSAIFIRNKIFHKVFAII